MGYTIRQHTLVNDTAKELVGLRGTVRQLAVSLKARSAPYPDDAQPFVDEAKTEAARDRARLDAVVANVAERRAAASAVGGAELEADLTARYQALNTAVAALESTTAATLQADLQATIDALPAESF